MWVGVPGQWPAVAMWLAVASQVVWSMHTPGTPSTAQSEKPASAEPLEPELEPALDPVLDPVLEPEELDALDTELEPAEALDDEPLAELEPDDALEASVEPAAPLVLPDEDPTGSSPAQPPSPTATAKRATAKVGPRARSVRKSTSMGPQGATAEPAARVLTGSLAGPSPLGAAAGVRSGSTGTGPPLDRCASRLDATII
jgi:hypothetical protein